MGKASRRKGKGRGLNYQSKQYTSWVGKSHLHKPPIQGIDSGEAARRGFEKKQDRAAGSVSFIKYNWVVEKHNTALANVEMLTGEREDLLLIIHRDAENIKEFKKIIVRRGDLLLELRKQADQDRAALLRSAAEIVSLEAEVQKWRAFYVAEEHNTEADRFEGVGDAEQQHHPALRVE